MIRTRVIQVTGVLGALLWLVGGSAAATYVSHLLFGADALSFATMLIMVLIAHLVVSTWKELGQ